MDKIDNHGITAEVLNWLNEWLTGRWQSVIKGHKSTWREITSGVLISVRSSLFLTFINDLDSSLVSSILKFADDTTMFRRDLGVMICSNLKPIGLCQHAYAKASKVLRSHCEDSNT